MTDQHRRPPTVIFPWFLLLLAAAVSLTVPRPMTGVVLGVTLCAAAIVAAIQGRGRPDGDGGDRTR